MLKASEKLVLRSHKIALILLVLVAIASITCLAGWALDQENLKTLFMGRKMILRSSTALSFLFCALALYLRGFRKGVDFAVVGAIAALISFVGASAAFAESVTATDFGLDKQIYTPNENSAGITFPGPMPPNVSLNFVFLSFSLLTMGLAINGKQWLWQIAALVSLGLSLMAFFGYLCGVESLCTMFGCVKMSSSVSVPLIFLSMAALCAQPEGEITKIFVMESLGGRIARRFLTFLLAIPVSLAIRSAGTALQLYDEAFGWAVFGILVFSSFIGVAIWSARTLDVVDSARQAAQKKQEEAEQQKEVIERKLVSEVARQVRAEKDLAKEPRLRNVCLECTKEYSMELEYCPDDKTMLAKLPDDSMIGTTLAEKYYVLEELGKGGMSKVYKVRHLFLEHQILAVKILQSHLASETTNVKRFQHEARTASRMNHPNLLRIHDFGIAKGGPYLVMDFVKGQSLDEILSECKRLDLVRFEEITQQILDGISYAHENGVVHRDLKPSNIMIIEQAGQPDQIKIVDFGLAKGDQPTDMQLTKPGELFGSPLYMSPEQWDSATIVDARSDIYSLGCLLYECLVGRPPFNKDSMLELLHDHLNAEAPPFPKALRIPEHIQHAILLCLAKKPENRPQTAKNLKAMLLGKPTSV